MVGLRFELIGKIAAFGFSSFGCGALQIGGVLDGG
jgi:hypothetical protein